MGDQAAHADRLTSHQRPTHELFELVGCTEMRSLKYESAITVCTSFENVAGAPISAVMARASSSLRAS
jgi:hypothetical protein